MKFGKKIFIIIILCVIALLLLFIGTRGKGTIVTAVTTDANGFSDFDNWLLDEVGITATPGHVFIKEGKVTNYVDYTITKEEFKQYLNNDICSLDVWDQPIELLNGEQVDLNIIDVIYITKSGCKACEEQQAYNEPQIFKKYRNLNILVYYISTDKSDAECLAGCG